ncbi:MAG: cytochrome P450 [Novosphingobium sp.]|nr:cytochrome P450 [Novosphingobium sp.]
MSVPSVDINLYGPEMAADPWPVVRHIRELGPLVWNERGQWITAHDRVCRQIMSRHEEATMKGVMTSTFGEGAFITMDDKQSHNALRNVWVHAFGKNGVDGLIPFTRQMIEGRLDAALAMLDADGTVDMQPVFCRPIPAYVIAHMMGVGEEMIPTIVEWSDNMATGTTSGHPIDYENDFYWLRAEKSRADLADFLLEQVQYRRDNPGEDLISRIVHSEIAATTPDWQMVVNLRQLLFAGNETTSNWLGHLVHILGSRPDVRAELAADRSLIPQALEEMLRWLGIVQAVPRMVGEGGMDVAGTHVPEGAHIMALIGAAGRDPERYADPDTFDIHREAKPHLGFGFGMHTCLGAILARMETAQAANALLDRMPPYRFAEPVTYDSFMLRGPSRLVIERAD